MSKYDLGEFAVRFAVKNYNDLGLAHEGMRYEDVARELEDWVETAVSQWYIIRGRKLLVDEPTVG